MVITPETLGTNVAVTVAVPPSVRELVAVMLVDALLGLAIET
jgi:hypothetical protein